MKFYHLKDDLLFEFLLRCVIKKRWAIAEAIMEYLKLEKRDIYLPYSLAVCSALKRLDPTHRYCYKLAAHLIQFRRRFNEVYLDPRLWEAFPDYFSDPLFDSTEILTLFIRKYQFSWIIDSFLSGAGMEFDLLLEIEERDILAIHTLRCLSKKEIFRVLKELLETLKKDRTAGMCTVCEAPLKDHRFDIRLHMILEEMGYLPLAWGGGNKDVTPILDYYISYKIAYRFQKDHSLFQLRFELSAQKDFVDYLTRRLLGLKQEGVVGRILLYPPYEFSGEKNPFRIFDDLTKGTPLE